MNSDSVRLYHTFLTVCNEGNFYKASKKLFITQPAVSQNIKTLEEELGIKLFLRTTRPLTLTSEGKLIKESLENLFTQINSTQDYISQITHGHAGSIKIGTPSYIASILLPNLISKLSTKIPYLKYEIICKDSEELFELFILKKIDLLIDSDPINPNLFHNYETKIIHEEQYCFVCTKEYKQTHNININSLSDLEEYTLIVPSKNSSCTKYLNQLFLSNNLKFNPKIYGSTTELVLNFVGQNLGIGYVMKSSTTPGLIQFNIKESLQLTKIYLVYNAITSSSIIKKIVSLLNNK